MVGEDERSFLGKSDLRDRLIAFANSDSTFASAANLGLLGLSVPPAYGGFFVRRERFYQVTGSLLWVVFGERLSIVQSHGFVCDHIRTNGKLAQHERYLPRLAAGKLIGVLAYLSMISVGAKECEDGFLLSGDTVARTVAQHVIGPHSLVCLYAILKSQVRIFVIEGSVLPTGRIVKRGWVHYELRQHFVAGHTLLGALDPDEEPSTEKWETIRWRTDRSAS